ncbi:imidazole glycerol phosphate synthase subunit HisH [Paenibacillus vortex V453]|uniref:Imidazole glycerol phosphate synthase subunit HisH n=2 Tax=Paenibacillus TaxID=44249 RepID=A0A163J3I3_9BACL|nr:MULTISPECIES: imidazole glycerol phosphate synthase subunit HisH [Paenibacillus]AWP30192.1 imidazole glycerol phosphate synthase subunit HisH [Paenibacillus sp. Cedars]EFU43280.1 imidazole glycerol phosphate synthase subunit HisH [Paenibacillus vortex V453]KZS46335.1 imidazole glycerol phosphate synthase, glutamine amidotransferase subunit [Paenibacillus glucanolyticus]MDH6671099.1 glutamine amidotransferase [Paenibacillus sp. LBL]
MAIAIVDYGMGNLHSVGKAVERLGYKPLVTGERDEILAADGIILPGVGAFGDAMEQLRETSLDSVMKEAADAGKPLLGICLGMQLLFSRSEEHGNHEGLNILPGSVVRFAGGDYKVPHMGWNSLQFEKREHPLFAGLEEGHVYFVHSYHVLPEVQTDLLAATDYGQPVTAIVGRGSVYGMQFHPEKSGELGMSLLRNFLLLTT